MNFGQRYLELATSYTKNSETGQVTMHVSQMPPNPNVFVPGPAMIYLVVDGVPSIGKVGSDVLIHICIFSPIVKKRVSFRPLLYTQIAFVETKN